MLSYSTCKTEGVPHGLPPPYFLKVDIVYTIRSIPLFLEQIYVLQINEPIT